jgi:hypothetical protein
MVVSAYGHCRPGTGCDNFKFVSGALHLRRLAEVDCPRPIEVKRAERDQAVLELAMNLLQLCLQDVFDVALAARVPGTVWVSR